MKKLIIMPLVALALVACNGNKIKTENQEPQSETTETKSELTLNGQWRLLDYPGETEIVTIPDDDDYILTINAEDNTFSMSTDCNTLSGQYTADAENISFGKDIIATMMACPNETVERDMKRILPMIDTYVITPDSSLILRADARKMATFKYVK